MLLQTATGCSHNQIDKKVTHFIRNLYALCNTPLEETARRYWLFLRSGIRSRKQQEQVKDLALAVTAPNTPISGRHRPNVPAWDSP